MSPELTTAERRARRADLNLFVEALRKAAHDYKFGLETRGVQVEIYDRTEVYEAGKPYAVLMVDGFEVKK